MAVVDPTLDLERELHAAGATWVIGCDEVGRGAIAGPVAVGLGAVHLECGEMPVGLRDSKLLSEKRREALYPTATSWVQAHAVGLADAREVDEIGIVAALGLAGRRALTALHEAGVGIMSSVVVLDGNHDYLTPALSTPPRITTRVKADRDCASVAAASVIAKVHRDRMMIAADDEHPGYGWAGNKGYGSTAHYAALTELGPSPLHRLTWLH
ncbi:ribonuclease HII [Frigoribacterium sp. Leaf164]|jgi:ribonuclease HII|uniref:ribonuclease HII n=1 Tax=unclassified Frigoribacterium TaxID=2627005 RepID=UPI0006FC4A2F|nr:MULTISPECIES: ribonuclease HII [unclassified Frigoribacterium]KQR46600.1 ribonuclease HII [Frigoribacterium sp. Leaf164]MBD8727397.1 ribonuclease HII [Frigoribacterium sp. CFBP 13707]